MKKQCVVALFIVCTVGLSYFSLSGVFDRGSIAPTPLVNPDNYYGTGLTTQQGADDKRKNPYNNPDLKEENEEFNGQMRYPPHSMEILRPALQ